MYCWFFFIIFCQCFFFIYDYCNFLLFISLSLSFSFFLLLSVPSFLCFTVFWYQGNSSIIKWIWISPTSSLVKSLGFPCGSAGKESVCNSGDLGFFPGLGKSPGEGNGYPLQYSGLENSTDCIVHGVAKSHIWLSDFHDLFQFLEDIV